MTCWRYRPDHNGECLHCDDGADAHPPLVFLVLTDHPRDFPEHYVIRAQWPDLHTNDGVVAAPIGCLYDTLDEAMTDGDLLASERGGVWMPRAADDDPVIVSGYMNDSSDVPQTVAQAWDIFIANCPVTGMGRAMMRHAFYAGATNLLVMLIDLRNNPRSLDAIERLYNELCRAAGADSNPDSRPDD